MFATAVKDGDLDRNPTLGVRINGRRSHEDEDEDEDEQQAKAMSRAELTAVLAALADRWRLRFELLGLEWDALVFGDRPRLRVRRKWYRGKLKPRPKSDAGRRELPLSPGMARKLLESGKNIRQVAAWLGHKP